MDSARDSRPERQTATGEKTLYQGTNEETVIREMGYRRRLKWSVQGHTQEVEGEETGV